MRGPTAFALSLLAGLATAACGTAPSETGTGAGNYPPPNPVVAQFVGPAPNEIQVAVRDRQPAQNVELIGPDGRVYVAYQINRDRVVERFGPYGRYDDPFYDPWRYNYPGAAFHPYYGRYGYGPNVGVGVGVGTGGGHTRFGTGIGFGFPLGYYGGPYYPDYPRELYTRSVARIQVANMNYYRATWPGWKLRIRLGEDKGEPRFIEVPGPKPPGV